jgi:hypothetical protein
LPQYTATEEGSVLALPIELDGVKKFTLFSPADDQYLWPRRMSGAGNFTALGSVKSVDPIALTVAVDQYGASLAHGEATVEREA